MTAERFEAVIEGRTNGGIAIRVPFDPNRSWGPKGAHHVAGTVHGIRVRGRLVLRGTDPYLELGPSWCRSPGVTAGDRVQVVLEAEGPQLATLPPDLRAALAADPVAQRAFVSLATFYRKGYVRDIVAAKRPETRARRIAETLAALQPQPNERNGK